MGILVGFPFFHFFSHVFGIGFGGGWATCFYFSRELTQYQAGKGFGLLAMIMPMVISVGTTLGLYSIFKDDNK